MKVFFGTDLVTATWPAATICIGVFDGVHLGHQTVIRSAVEKARENGEPCALVTFDRHPAWILAPDRVPASLATLSQNLEQFARMEIDIGVVLPFNRAIADTSADEFFGQTLLGKLHAARVVVGHDFAFGHDRAGTTAWLSQRIETHVVPPFEMDGHRVSSTEIRSAVATGDMVLAGRLLGREFSLQGIVVPGEQLGRTLGFPTANVAADPLQALPADGVYAASCATPFGRFLAATSIGTRPTVGGKGRTIEAYLIDYPGQLLYGRSVEVSFKNRIRDELHFEHVDALVEQIGKDVEAVRTL
ncbi:MAG: bifunctional riboflavin kinase/FAD synthetase [Armatimonadetes bacterium]|nr:bifunctional riboflavin kinase/FAD synthetase [Armatimonadota bacterium]